MSYQIWIGAGNVGADPDIRYMPNGTAVCNLSLATTEYWTKDGVKQEKTSWHRLTYFGPVVEKVIKPYVKKGSKILAEGVLDYQEWTDKNSGEKKYATNIKCTVCKLIGSRNDSTGQAPQQAPAQAKAASAPAGGSPDFDDSIPF